MNNLGILGLGSVSTLYYIETLNNAFHKKHGGYSTCPFTMINTNFNHINPHLPNDFVSVKKNISPYLKYIDSLKIKNLIIPNITIHESVDEVMKEENFNLKLIHPIEVLIEHLIYENIHEIILLGTKYTMNSDYIKTKLYKNGISIIPLDNSTINKVEKIRNDVYEGKIKKSKELLQKNLKKYSNKKIVLACTELSVAANNDISFIDMVSLQIKKAIQLT